MNAESPIERQILDYLAANPAARDTLRGIAEWWVLKQRISEATPTILAAVASLVAQGKLSARSGPDGQVYFGSPTGGRRTAGSAQPPERSSGGSGIGEAATNGSSDESRTNKRH
ncbi:MAG: hypothetical protein KGS61_01100 [Verrucomicrobia bacterium]|nr:hypothetical protein [Verrucomicrobiota bacterium]